MTKRALISVSDKAGIVEFAQELKNSVGTSSQQVGLKLPLTMLGRYHCHRRCDWFPRNDGRSCEDSSSKYPRWSARSS